MNIIAESVRIRVELDAESINDYLKLYLPEALFTIGQSGKIILSGKIGILPFRVIVNEIKYGARHISLIFSSSFLSILSSLVLRFSSADYLNFNLSNKELNIDVYKLIKSSHFTAPHYPNIDDVIIEKCFIEDDKIILTVSLSGENNLL